MDSDHVFAAAEYFGGAWDAALAIADKRVGWFVPEGIRSQVGWLLTAAADLLRSLTLARTEIKVLEDNRTLLLATLKQAREAVEHAGKVVDELTVDNSRLRARRDHYRSKYLAMAKGKQESLVVGVDTPILNAEQIRQQLTKVSNQLDKLTELTREII